MSEALVNQATTLSPSQRVVSGKRIKQGKREKGMLFLIKKITQFEDIKLTYNLPGFPNSRMAKPDEHMAGFCIVFDDYEKALEWAGDPKLIQPVDYVNPPVEATR
jgi:hypothetical protein